MFVRKPDAAVCSALFGKVKRGPEGFAQVNANLRAKILDFVLQLFEGRFALAAFKLGIVYRFGMLGRDNDLHCIGGTKESVFEERVGHRFYECCRLVDVLGEEHDCFGIPLECCREIELTGFISGYIQKPTVQLFRTVETLEKIT